MKAITKVTSKNVKKIMRKYAENGVLRLPDTIIEISENAFSKVHFIRKIVIPDSVKYIDPGAFKEANVVEVEIIGGFSTLTIGDHAFFQSFIESFKCNREIILDDVAFGLCKNLEEVCIGNNCLKNIPCGCFWKTAISSINIPEGVEVIRAQAFENCQSLENIHLPDSLINIEKDAFKCCFRLKQVTIPKNVKEIPDGCFCSCNELEKVWGFNITQIGTNAFSNCTFLKEVYFEYPEETDGSLSIQNFAFSECRNLSILKTKNKIKSIGMHSFEYCCKLEEIDLKMVSCIPDYAFKECVNLTNVFTGEDLQEIESYAFESCMSLKHMPNSRQLKYIGSYAFKGCCRLEKVKLFPYLESLGECAFSKCTSLEVVNINPLSLLEITSSAFKECINLATVIIEGTEDSILKKIGPFAFYDCNMLKEISLPSSIEEIGEEAFYDCINLEKIEFGENLYKVGDGAFFSCLRLKSLIFPESTKVFGSKVFFNCKNLEKIVMASPQSIGEDFISGCEKLENLRLTISSDSSENSLE